MRATCLCHCTIEICFERLLLNLERRAGTKENANQLRTRWITGNAIFALG